MIVLALLDAVHRAVTGLVSTLARIDRQVHTFARFMAAVGGLPVWSQTVAGFATSAVLETVVLRRNPPDDTGTVVAAVVLLCVVYRWVIAGRRRGDHYMLWGFMFVFGAAELWLATTRLDDPVSVVIGIAAYATAVYALAASGPPPEPEKDAL